MLLGSQQTSRRRSVSLDRGRIVGGVLRQLPSVSNSPTDSLSSSIFTLTSILSLRACLEGCPEHDQVCRMPREGSLPVRMPKVQKVSFRTENAMVVCRLHQQVGHKGLVLLRPGLLQEVL